jgi:tRNA(Glu) U13 pseudouridine synthase TruD
MIDEKIILELREYLKDHYIPARNINIFSAGMASISSYNKTYSVKEIASFRDISDEASNYIKKHRKPGGFAHDLDRKRKEKRLSPAELYKRANIDRRQYSRFMGPEGRHPSMNTVISFALALRLERREFDEFMQTAGYSLSDASTRDVCVMFCLEKGIYDIDEVNALLFAIGVEPLSRDSNA